MAKVAQVVYQDNEFKLSGELDYCNVVSLYEHCATQIKQAEAEGQTLVFNFANIKSSNSAGLALIIEWIKLANQQHKKIQFKSLSPEIISIAKVSGLDKFVFNS